MKIAITITLKVEAESTAVVHDRPELEHAFIEEQLREPVKTALHAFHGRPMTQFAIRADVKQGVS